MNFLIRDGDNMRSITVKHVYTFLSFAIIVLVALVPKGVFAQTLPIIDVTDLNLTFVGPMPDAVDAGSVISTQIMVNLVTRDNPIAVEQVLSVPASETVTAVVELRDKFNNIISTHSQSFSGFSNTRNDRVLDNSPGSGGEAYVSFQIPWSEASKITDKDDLWTIAAYVTGSSIESRFEDNDLSHQFTINIPNLTLNSPMAITGTSDPEYLPGSNVILSAVVTNSGIVQTPPGSFFGVEARLLDQARNIVDSETIILPDSTDGSTATIDPESANSVPIEFSGLRIPMGTVDTNMSVLLSIDQRFNIIPEGNETDNVFELTFPLPTNVITPRLTILESSFSGEAGRFDGLEPIRISFSVRNEGNTAISADDDLRIRAVLSTDDTYDSSDFILREFNFGGDPGELGFDLLPNENVFLDWVQQLPDNLEGDYYVLASVVDANGNIIETFPLDNTPSITLRSENVASLERVVAGTNPNERPDASKDGRFVVFEETDSSGIKQIYFRDTVVGGPPVLVSKDIDSNSTNNIGGNQNSLRPKISSDGQIITFHSRATNLVPNDKNEHADVFLYKTINGQVIRALNASENKEPNGPSLYPDINGDGSKIVFQSRATNLVADGTITNGEQIFLWDTTIGTYGEISAITSGNNDSRLVSIDDDGDTLVFSSEATDLDDFGKPDLNGKSDIYAHDLPLGQTWVVSLNPRLETRSNGSSDQPVISGNGDFFVFRSDATDLVRDRGISTIEVVNGGVGYFGNPQALVSDDFGSGEGAILSLENAIDDYGQIMPGMIKIIDPGRNYVDPRITIIPDPQEAIPTTVADVKAFLSHPDGEVYYAQLGVAGEYDVVAGSLQRVSENALGVGGNEGSKDPHIDYSGSRIVYSTKSSNLLPVSLTRPDGTTYLNRSSAMAKAKAIIVGGIGEIEVANAGSGYQSGFLTIADTSGRGSGATAEFEVDDLGQISSINVLTPGQDYDLDNTTVTIAVPGAGTGFLAGEIRFVLEQGIGNQRTGGGRIHGIEMVDHGFGYDSDANNSNLIRIEGDGADLDGDGSPDAKIDPSSFHIDSTTGAVYLIQTFELELLSTASLLSTELYIEDANDSITIDFSVNTPGVSTVIIGSPVEDLDVIRGRIIDKINANWNTPASISMGPQISDDFNGGNSFTLKSISGKLSTNNITSIQIKRRSNMLFGGSGFTRATPSISPGPAIFGFSEVLAGTNTEISDSGRPLYEVVEDRFTDDVYLFDAGTGTNTRVSRSKFGFPANYLAESNTTLPSNRFPSLSGNGRFVYFSSDADGNGSLVFGISNQLPDDENQVRDIYHVDLKTTSLTEVDIAVNMLYPSEYASVTFGANSLIPIIAQIDYNGSDISSVDLFVNNQFVQTLDHFEPNLNSNRWTTNYTTSSFAGDYIYQIIVYNEAGEQLGASIPRIIKVSEYNSRPPVADLLDFNDTSMSTTSTKRITARGQDFDGTLVGIQFYLDGVPYGNEILRSSEIAQDLANYTVDLTSAIPGVKSLFVIARDNSGNHVASSVQTISVTPGSTSATISLTHGPEQLHLNSSQLNVQVDASGTIQSVSLVQPMGNNFLGETKTEILGSGLGASLEAILDQNTSSGNYGKVSGFTVLNGGSGYDQNISISVMPVLRLVGYGRPAEISAARTAIRNQFGSITGWTYHYGLKKDVSGNDLSGYGYAIAPRWEIQNSNGGYFTFTDITTNGLVNYERLTLIDNNFTTGGVAPINRDGTDILNIVTGIGGHLGNRLLGGFTQSPCFYRYEVTQTNEPLERVQFFVDGRLIDEKQTPPFSFTFIADDPGEYSIYASAIDKSGNIATSQANKVHVERYLGSGISSGLSLESDYAIAADTKTILTASASAESGVAEVEFYINETSYAKVLGDGRLEAFIAEVDLGGLNQGRHELTLVARDFAGNYAGTFTSALTNIESRQNEIFTITAKLPSSQPPDVELLYPPVLKRMTNSSTIYLQATAFDVDGRLEGVQFYVNGKAFGNEIPHDRTKTQKGYPFGIAWSPTDEGVYLINAVARDSSGNKSLSETSTVTVTLGDNLVPNVNLTALNSEYEASQSIFLSAQISDEANSSTGLGVIEDVQFFANGVVIRDFNNTGPFFEVWSPDSGIYEVYAMAVDNEGNHAISDINTVFVGVLDDFDEQPQLGSIKPTLDAAPLRISLSRRSGRRTAEGVVSITSIAGLPQSTLENLVADQVIRFTDGTQTSSEYTIALITEDGALEVNGDVSAEDEAILLGATQIEMIPIFTAGSSIYLSLKPDVDDSNFDSVTFYIDGTLWSTDNSWPFSTVFSPTQEGNYTISVVAENQFQNKTLYSERLFVESSRGLVPSGAAEIMPDVTTRDNPTAFAVTLGSKLTLLAAYDDLDDGMSRVEFYLNGKLMKVDHQPPYYYTFTPTTESNALVEGGYEMAVVGIDYAGNRFSNVFQGVIDGSTVLPSTIVKAPNNMEEFSEGQSVEFKVEVVGSLTPSLLGFSSDPSINQNPNINRFPRRMAIMANGEFVSVATESGWGTGVFVGDLIIDLNQAGPDGIVELFGTMLAEDYTIINEFGTMASFSPTIFSNTVKIKVTEPNLAVDPQSAVNQTFNDLLGFNPSQAEVTNALTEEMDAGGYLFENQSFLNWAAKVSNRDSFQNMVDAIGGFHIMTGQWPLTTKVEEILNTYSASPNNNADGSGDADGDGYSLLQEIRFQTDDQDPTSFPPPAFRIESFVDETLASNDFTDLHGRVPVLTPPPGIDAVGTTNYDKNRRDFVNIIFSNKYGFPPSPAQELQASFRIASLDPNSPEALYAQQLAIFEQLAMYASFGYGVSQGGGNNNAIVLPTVQPIPIDQYLNAGGLPATLFVTNMIAEQLIDNQPMILGAAEKRSYYETAALIVALWSDNLETLTDKLIDEFHSLSKEDKIAKLMKDPRYFNRFGGYSISRMAEELPASPGWKWLEWLGYFNDDGFPWIYHDILGWVYVDGTNDDQIWLYLPNAGWLGTTKEIWEGMDGESDYLWLYDNQAAKWVAFYLHKTSKATFWDPVTQKYFTYE